VERDCRWADRRGAGWARILWSPRTAADHEEVEMTHTTSHCPLARIHHGLPRLTLWALLGLLVAVGAAVSFT
jgi:hypothetical protein